MPSCSQVLKHSFLHRNANIHRQGLRNLSWDFVKSSLTRQVDWENILIYSSCLREQSHNKEGRAVMVHISVIFCMCVCVRRLWNKVAHLVKLWNQKSTTVFSIVIKYFICVMHFRCRACISLQNISPQFLHALWKICFNANRVGLYWNKWPVIGFVLVQVY